jgi:hypothetical protein
MQCNAAIAVPILDLLRSHALTTGVITGVITGTLCADNNDKRGGTVQ